MAWPVTAVMENNLCKGLARVDLKRGDDIRAGGQAKGGHQNEESPEE